MIDLSEHWLLVYTLACVAELTYRMYARSAASSSTLTTDRLANTLRLGLHETTRWTPFGVSFEIRLARHYHWVRNQGAERPEEWKR